jgi:hypothetical protein
MERSLRFRRQWNWIALIPMLLFACENNDNTLTPEQTQTRTALAAQDNGQILSITQEVLDLTSLALVDKGVGNGRRSSGGRLSDHDYMCYPTISASYDVKKTADNLVYSGTMTIDFGDGSSCEDSTYVKRGKITDLFKYVISYADSIPYSSVEAITFDHFERDSVGLDGTFTSSYSSDGSQTIDINDAVLTYADGTSTHWSGSLAYLYDNAGSVWNWKDDIKTLTGSLSGTTREGQPFTSEITKEVQFTNACMGRHDIPVSGTVTITVGGTTSEVDYGDGTCDKSYTITVNGETTTYTFGQKNA